MHNKLTFIDKKLILMILRNIIFTYRYFYFGSFYFNQGIILYIKMFWIRIVLSTFIHFVHNFFLHLSHSTYKQLGILIKTPVN